MEEGLQSNTSGNDNELKAQEPEVQQVFYPPVPQLQQPTPHIRKTIISALIFVAVLAMFMELPIVLTVLGVLFIHEVGHLIAMKVFGFENVRMLFLPMAGAMVMGEKPDASDKEQAIIALAGPVPGIILGMGIYFFMGRGGHIGFGELSSILILINLFNLLPILPLDGARLIQYLFFSGSLMVQFIFMIISAGVMFILALEMHSIFLAILPVFMGFRAAMMLKLRKIRGTLLKEGLDLEQRYEDLKPKDYWQIRRVLVNSFAQYRKLIDPDVFQYSAIESKIAVQVKGALTATSRKELGVFGKILFLLIWIAAFILPILYVAIPLMENFSKH